jgi:hypothetical protein
MDTTLNGSAVGGIGNSIDHLKAQGSGIGYLQQVSPNPHRCECHECTQARWKMHGSGLNNPQVFYK